MDKIETLYSRLEYFCNTAGIVGGVKLGGVWKELNEECHYDKYKVLYSIVYESHDSYISALSGVLSEKLDRSLIFEIQKAFYTA